MFIGISLKCVYPIMVEEGDLWCSDFCKIYLSVKYLQYPLTKFSPRLSSSVWIGFEHPPLYIEPSIWLILLPPILYFILFFYFWQYFFDNIDPNEMWNKYTKTNSSKLNKLKIRTQVWPSSTPYHTPFLNSHPRHTSIWITPHFHKTILSNLFYYFSKISTPLIYKEKGFHNTIIPQTKEVYSSPRPHFSKYVTPTNWKEGEGTRKTAKSNQCSCGEIKSNIRFVLHVSSLILDKLYIVLETVFSKLKLFNIKQSLVEKSYIMARSRTLL